MGRKICMGGDDRQVIWPNVKLDNMVITLRYRYNYTMKTKAKRFQVYHNKYNTEMLGGRYKLFSSLHNSPFGSYMY